MGTCARGGELAPKNTTRERVSSTGREGSHATAVGVMPPSDWLFGLSKLNYKFIWTEGFLPKAPSDDVRKVEGVHVVFTEPKA